MVRLVPILAFCAALAAGPGARAQTPLAPALGPRTDRPLEVVVDASDQLRGLIAVHETLPVQSGPLTLYYPRWLPGVHAPSDTIARLAGLTVLWGGKTLAWRRDAYDPYAFHLEIPPGDAPLQVNFQYQATQGDRQGSSTPAPELDLIDWSRLTLYPAGRDVRDIPVRASLIVPTGWRSASALRGVTDGGRIDYPVTDYATLIDSPVLASRNLRAYDLTSGVTLQVASPEPGQAAATADQIARHADLVTQALRLFGSPRYDHYDFLVTLSDDDAGDGLEHQRSSALSLPTDYFLAWEANGPLRATPAHELVHSWNGKARRPADLWAPNYNQPTSDALLWVYEGQTQFWGDVLAARSGLISAQDARDLLAARAADDAHSAGRTWRSIGDSAFDPVIGHLGSRPWADYTWARAYYFAAELLWLDIDQRLREKTGDQRSLDDFARRFFDGRPGDGSLSTYDRQDVIDTLQAICPDDWAGYFRAHVDAPGADTALTWIGRSGYKLVYDDEESAFWHREDALLQRTRLSFSIGVSIGADGRIQEVRWDSPAFTAGLAVGVQVLGVNGQAYRPDILKRAIVAARDPAAPVRLRVRQNGREREVVLNWRGGLGYPHLVKVVPGEARLDRLLAPRPEPATLEARVQAR